MLINFILGAYLAFWQEYNYCKLDYELKVQKIFLTLEWLLNGILKWYVCYY